jgi:DNA replication protein DnaC
VKAFNHFDLGFQPLIDEREILELRILHEASNVILMGPPDAGKSHLALTLTETAI